MTGSGVPTATSAGAPRISRIAGVVMMPPPMPNAPESTPETKPIPSVASCVRIGRLRLPLRIA